MPVKLCYVFVPHCSLHYNPDVSGGWTYTEYTEGANIRQNLLGQAKLVGTPAIVGVSFQIIFHTAWWLCSLSHTSTLLY